MRYFGLSTVVLLLFIPLNHVVTSYNNLLSTRRRFCLKESVAFIGGVGSAAAILSSGAGLSPPPAYAASGYTSYNDPLHGFSIDVPDNWAHSTQTLPDRRKIEVWTDPADVKTLLFVAYTPVRDDFTSLASFGSVDQVASQTILPKGKIAGRDVEAQMLSSASKNQAYYFDYTQAVPDVQPLTHMRAIFSLQQGATGGAGAVLVTVTAQSPQERYEKTVKPIFDHVVDSYGKSLSS